jgi:hypothetical protein
MAFSPCIIFSNSHALSRLVDNAVEPCKSDPRLLRRLNGRLSHLLPSNQVVGSAQKARIVESKNPLLYKTRDGRLRIHEVGRSSLVSQK